MATIYSLPLELLWQVVDHLSFWELVNFAQSDKRFFKQLFGSALYCRELVEKHIPCSEEAKLAARGKISYQKAILTCFQKHESFAQGKPLEVTSLDPGDEFMYRGGCLCVRHESLVTVLDPRAQTNERLDLSTALSLQTITKNIRYSLLNFSVDILSVRVDTDTASAVASLQLTGQGRYSHERSQVISIQTSDELVQVRNDKDHIVIAIFRAGAEGDAWHFQISTLDRKSAIESTKYLNVGQFSSPDIGIDLVFEVVDGYFWIVSSQVTIDPEGKDPLSYFGGCRCELAGQNEQPEFWKIWRRRHVDGPIDEQWTTLTFGTTVHGDYFISESRNEWLSDGQKLRTFYSCIFQPGEFMPAEVGPEDTHAVQTLARKAQTDEFDFIEEIIAGVSEDTLTVFKDEQIRHPEFGMSNNGRSTSYNCSSYRTNQTVASFFHHAADAFVDLVLHSTYTREDPELKLRFGSRHVAPVPISPGSTEIRSTFHPSAELDAANYSKSKGDHPQNYVHNPIVLFPSQPHPNFSQYMSKSHHGTLFSADEKTIVFGPNFRDDPAARSCKNKRIVIVSFDPLASWAMLQTFSSTQLNAGDPLVDHTADNTSSRFQLLSILTTSSARPPTPTHDDGQALFGIPLNQSNDDDLELYSMDEEMRDALAGSAAQCFHGDSDTSELENEEDDDTESTQKRRISSESLQKPGYNGEGSSENPPATVEADVSSRIAPTKRVKTGGREYSDDDWATSLSLQPLPPR